MSRICLLGAGFCLGGYAENYLGFKGSGADWGSSFSWIVFEIVALDDCIEPGIVNGYLLSLYILVVVVIPFLLSSWDFLSEFFNIFLL